MFGFYIIMFPSSRISSTIPRLLQCVQKYPARLQTSGLKPLQQDSAEIRFGFSVDQLSSKDRSNREKALTSLKAKKIEEFNHWKKELDEQGIILNLRQADLQGGFLKNANLKHSDLRESNLRNTFLYCANLEYANLRGAHLEDANLEGANFQNSNVTDTWINPLNSLKGLTEEQLIGYGFEISNGFAFGYRTQKGLYNGIYEPGKLYTSNAFNPDNKKMHQPGLHFMATTEEVLTHFSNPKIQLIKIKMPVNSIIRAEDGKDNSYEYRTPSFEVITLVDSDGNEIEQKEKSR